MKKILCVLTLIFIVGMVYSNAVYADPNSSIGFAEYDDEKAEEESQKMQEEQENQLNEVAGKSSNNYLESLKVEGYEISPQFDKQTLEYTINEEIKEDKINIQATADDEKAKVDGAGEITLNNGENECRIDVTAESGTVRTYLIKVKTTNGQENNDEQNVTDEDKIVEEYGEKQAEKTDFNYAPIIILVILVLLVCIIAILLKKKNNGKH